MEETSKQVNITLDDKSIEILKSVDSIHRDSIINIGLALVKKTGYYKTLAGVLDNDADLEDVASLDIEDSEEKTTKKTKKKADATEEKPKKATQSWDAF